MLNFNFKSLLWLVPAAVAGVKLTKPINKKERNLYLAIGAGSLLGFAAANTSKNENTTFDDIPVDGPFNEALVQSVVNELSNTLLKTLSPFSLFERCNAMERYAKVPENEFKTIANRFKAKNGKTIRTAIAETYGTGCYHGVEWSHKVIERLNSFNIASTQHHASSKNCRCRNCRALHIAKARQQKYLNRYRGRGFEQLWI